MLSITCNCWSSNKLINEWFDLNQLIELTNSYLGMWVLQLRNASLDGLENYIFVHAKINLTCMFLCCIFIFLKRKNANFLHVVITAILEITQDALNAHQTHRINVFWLNKHWFKLLKCSKTKIILFPSRLNQ